MGRKKNKQPKIPKGSVLPQKEVRKSIDLDEYLEKKPVWQIGRIDNDGEWGWQHIGKDRWENEILPKLTNFETMTWKEIEAASGGKKKGNNSHFIGVESLSKEAQKRLKILKMEDIDNLYSLRFAAKIRVYGKRVGSVMQLLWFDFNHEVCPSKKRRT